MDNEAQGRALGEWYVKMYEAYRAMGDDDKDALREWEGKHVKRQGKTHISDWPGWAQLIGPKPQL